MPSTTRPASPCAPSSSSRRRRVLWLCAPSFASASFAACGLLPVASTALCPLFLRFADFRPCLFLLCSVVVVASSVLSFQCFVPSSCHCFPLSLFFFPSCCACSRFSRVGLPHAFVSHHCCFVPYARPAMKPFPKYKSCGVWRCVGDGICASSTVRGVREPAARPWQVVASERIGSDLP